MGGPDLEYAIGHTKETIRIKDSKSLLLPPHLIGFDNFAINA